MAESAYKDNYDACKETWVQFQVTSPTLRADQISNALRAKPTSTEKEGQNGAVWLIETTAEKSRDIRRHFDLLLKKLEQAGPGLKELRARPDTYVAVLCRWQGNGFPHGPTISPPQMKALADLDLEIMIGIDETRSWWESWKFNLVALPLIAIVAAVLRH